MKSILTFLLCLFINLYAQNPAPVQLKWYKNYPAIDSSDNYLSADSKNTALDKEGNLYLLLSDSTLPGNFPFKRFKLTKYNSSGLFLWQVKSEDIESNNYVADILAVDNSDNIYVAANTLENGVQGELLLLKFNQDGDTLWSRKYNGSLINSFSSPLEIKFDSNENIILFGYCGKTENKIPQNDSLLIIKYSQSGNREWVAETSSDSIIYRAHCSLDYLDNIFVSGEDISFSHQIRFAKYNSSGEQVWSTSFSDSDYSFEAIDLTADKNSDYFVCGISLTPSFNSAWIIIMLDKNGQIKWHKYIDRDLSSDVYEIPWSIKIDGNNFINILGYENKNNISSFFLLKYNTNGSKISESAFIDSTMEYVRRASMDSFGNLYTAGFSLNLDQVTLNKFDNHGDKMWSSDSLSGGIKSPNNGMNLILDDAGNIYLTTEDSSKKVNIHDVIVSRYNKENGKEIWTVRSNEFLKHQVTSVSSDYTGDTYITGWIENGRGLNKDFITIKYDSAGKISWINRYDGPGHSTDIPAATTVDNEGNVFITGKSKGNLNPDYATIKYNSNGENEWIKRYDGGNVDIPQAIAVDQNGYVYVSGSSIGANSNYDFATIKYNKFGQVQPQWPQIYNDKNNGKDSVVSIAVDNLGDIFVAGTSDSTGSLYNYLVIKYAPSGNMLWVRRYYSEGDLWEKARKMIIDRKNNIYITGTSFRNDTKEDITTVKYNSNGELLWAKRWSNPGSSSDEVNDIKADKDGNVYIAGYGSGSGTGQDFITIKYDSSGNQKWAVSYDNSQNSDDFAVSLALDYLDNCYALGYSLNNRNYQYSLVKYDTNGIELWNENYQYAPLSNSLPIDLKVDNNGNIIIGGYSGDSYWSVFNLIKYSQPGFIPTGILESSKGINEFKLYQNFPNPFNPVTTIKYSIPQNSFVKIKLYDILGREIKIIASKEERAGLHEVKLDASNLSSGVYFYTIHAGDFIDSKKMIILK